MKRIDEEAICADSLETYLRSVCGHENVEIRKADEDPPDYWLRVYAKRFAAEVTSIVTGEGYRGQCKRLEREIAAKLEESGGPDGTYLLIPRGHPELPKRQSREWNALIDAICARTRAGRAAAGPEASDDVFPTTGRGRLVLQKVDDCGKALFFLPPIESKWLEAKLPRLLQDRVDAKRRKLERVPRECPKILLLYDAYGAPPETVRKAMEQVNDYEWLHSIFWVASFTDRADEFNPGRLARQGFFLYSQDPTWSRGPRTV